MDASKLAEEENTVSEDTAKTEVLRIFEFYDVELNDDNAALVEKLARAVSSGRLEVFDTEDGVCVRQTLRKPVKDIRKFEYGVVCGKTKLATKNIPPTDPYSQMFAMLGALAGVPAATFMEVQGPDFSTCEALALVFFKG